ncbi:transcriptional regulator GlcC [Paraburkholderia dipogonis]|uniref:Transcriptional regulator GlcC n=1 Tax=Paraburkholderia dipogonis TaxID=1211383 RepID=A0A4Y8MJ08_9BURK|nr:transcriptional regulator GlcC [Paraburkholderia dipogonis]TFE37364.1 transcriptional regulator GlcC [Paraburkholderia dipogonis]
MNTDAKRHLADVVVERIEQLIVDGVVRQGQTLPSERRLTEKLGVSRTALREGLKILRARGVIDTAHGKGSFVAQLTAEPTQAPMLQLLCSQPRTLYDLLEVREMLEAESARLAALRATPADHILIRRRYEDMSGANATDTHASKHAQLDHAFHQAICEASHNPVLVHTLGMLNDLMLSSVFASVNNLYHRQPQKREIDRQHAKLYNAIIGRRPEQARRAAEQHIKSVRESLSEIEQEERRLVRSTLRLEGWD